MKNFGNWFVVFLSIALGFPSLGISQEALTFELTYEVNRTYPGISIAKETLNEANTLIDLNTYFKPSWIREYLSVHILTSHIGSMRTAVSKNDTLSQEQKDFMYLADEGKDISVIVQYIPENALTHNDVKEMRFSFNVAPETEAAYAEGQEQLRIYLKEKAIDKISDASFTGWDLAAVKFTINEEGQIVDAHMFQAYDDGIDELLLETICNMPSWKPAEYSTGVNVKQEFVFVVGSMDNCIVPLLNIQQGTE